MPGRGKGVETGTQVVAASCAMVSLSEAIEKANSLLPGTPGPDGEDPRWQAILEVGHYIESNPEGVWQFVRRWGGHPQEDLRDAVACCLLEHLLEHHFSLIFPRVAQAAKRDVLFADTFRRCWKVGQSLSPGYSEEFDRLKAWCKERLKG